MQNSACIWTSASMAVAAVRSKGIEDIAPGCDDREVCHVWASGAVTRFDAIDSRLCAATSATSLSQNDHVNQEGTLANITPARLTPTTLLMIVSGIPACSALVINQRPEHVDVSQSSTLHLASIIHSDNLPSAPQAF